MLAPGRLAGLAGPPPRRAQRWPWSAVVRLVHAASVLAAFGTTLPAHAQAVGSTFWQTGAAACVPTDVTLRGAQYATPEDGGYVRYGESSNSTAPLTFVCPVSALNTGVQGGLLELLLYHQDPDGTGTGHQVRATLKSFSKATGAYDADVCQVTSHSSSPWGRAGDYCGQFDFDDHYYWVEVVLTRPAGGPVSSRFMGVSLVGVIG